MPNTVWGTDMTKTRTGDGWAYVHVVIDWGKKKLLALEASLTSWTSDWIGALDRAVNLQFPDGIIQEDPYGLIPAIVSDNGCQPTSKAYSDYEKSLGLEHIFTSYCNPKGDADTECVIRPLKEDLLWINDSAPWLNSRNACGSGSMTTTAFSLILHWSIALLWNMRIYGIRARHRKIPEQ